MSFVVSQGTNFQGAQMESLNILVLPSITKSCRFSELLTFFFFTFMLYCKSVKHYNAELQIHLQMPS